MERERYYLVLCTSISKEILKPTGKFRDSHHLLHARVYAVSNWVWYVFAIFMVINDSDDGDDYDENAAANVVNYVVKYVVFS